MTIPREQILAWLHDPAEDVRRRALLHLDPAAIDAADWVAPVGDALPLPALQWEALRVLSKAARLGKNIAAAQPALEALRGESFVPKPGSEIQSPMLSVAARAAGVLASFHLVQGHVALLSSEMARPGWRGLVALHALRSASQASQLAPFLPWLEEATAPPLEVPAPGFPDWATRRGFAAQPIAHGRWLEADWARLVALLRADAQVSTAVVGYLDDRAEADPRSITPLLTAVVRLFAAHGTEEATVRKAAARVLVWPALAGKRPKRWRIDAVDVMQLPEVREALAEIRAFARRNRQ